MTSIDAVLAPYLDALRSAHGPLDLYDAHTHVGANDPDGYRQRPDELLERLARADARAVVFPMHEPDGYPPANDAVRAAVADAPDRLVWFCRVDPKLGAAAVDEARRCLDAGARGIKLHPRAEGFAMSEPAVRDLVALVAARRLPLLIHAGRGIPALGEHAVELAKEFPDARIILAHAGISDLAWMWRSMHEVRNLYLDTSWWNPADLLGVALLVPPGQVLWASDSPYGTPVQAALLGLRCAAQAGLPDEALRSIAGGQIERLVGGEDPLDLGPAPGPGAAHAVHPTLDRISSHLIAAVSRAFVRGNPSEALALARLACDPVENGSVGTISRLVLELLDEAEPHLQVPPADGRPFPAVLRLVVFALTLTRTPDVALP